jgi:hypothetical protein
VPNLRSSPAAVSKAELDCLDDDALFALRPCDLVRRGGTQLARRFARPHREPAAHSILAHPHSWLAEDFFTPDAPPRTQPIMVEPHMRIVEGTCVRAHSIDQLLRQMIARAHILGLRVNDPEDVTLERVLVLLTMQTGRFVHMGFPKAAL